MLHLPKWIRNVITEPDNQTVCIVRLMSIAGVAEFLFIAAKVALKAQAFDMQSFGIGFGSLLGGIGAALKLKKDTLPTDDQPK